MWETPEKEGARTDKNAIQNWKIGMRTSIQFIVWTEDVWLFDSFAALSISLSLCASTVDMPET